MLNASNAGHARPWHVASAPLAVAILLFGVLAEVAVAAPRHRDWTSVRHPVHGFMIAYPSEVFTPKEGAPTEDGRVFVSPDGKAKLLVGTFENSAEFTLEAYREFLLRENYTGAKIDYERTKGKWFVISGVRDDTMFYERVSFTCGGRLVNSWAMLYPVAERKFYDRIVEAVARSYHPGAGANGNCADAAVAPTGETPADE